MRALTRVTIQKIKTLGVLQFEFYVVKGGATNRDVLVLATIRYVGLVRNNNYSLLVGKSGFKKNSILVKIFVSFQTSLP